MSVIATLAVKLQAQIAEFQGEFKEAARSTEKFQQEFEKTATKASAYGNLISRGLEIGIRAVGQLGEAALRNASTIDDLSKKTGLSMRTIQEFQHVAGETGATVDQFANAAFRLGTNLSGGSKSVVAGVKELGLSFDDLRAKSPDEQFRTVIKALEDMSDQQDANRIGVLLFGKTYKEIAVAVAEGYSDLADGARIMADAQVKRLAEAEDAWERLGRTTVIITGEIIAGTGDLISRLTDSWGNFFQFLARGASAGFQFPISPSGYQAPTYNTDLDRQFQEAVRRQSRERIDAAQKAGDAEEDAFKRSQKAAEDYAEVLKRVRDAQIPLTAAQKEYIEKNEAFNISTSDTAKVLRISEVAVGNYAKALDDLKKADLKSLADDIKSVDQRTSDVAEAFDKAAKEAKEMGDDLQSLRDDIMSVDEALTKTDAAFWADEQKESLKSLRDEIALVAKEVETAPALTGKQKLFGELEDIAFQTGHDIAGLIGEGIRTGDWSSFEDNLRDALAEGMGAAAAAAVNFFVPGLGTLLQPIFSGISDLLLGALGLGTTDYERRARENAEALRELRDAANDAAGGFANLQLRAQLAAPHLVEALRTQDAAYLKIVLAELDEAFGDLQERIADTWGALAEGARGSGELLDASLTPFIQQLQNAGVITDDLALSLLQMTTDNSAGWREMQSLAEKYGIELSGLGGTFQQQKLTETAGEIISAFDRLVNNSADFNAVLLGMTDEINNVVIESLRFGTEIPENMRPWIEALIESRDLVDDTGVAITDIDRLKFGPAVKSDVDKLIEAIRELIAAIGTKLPSAIRDLAGVRVDPIRIPFKYEMEGEFPTGIPGLASGGVVRRPTLAWLGEEGPEAVVPLSQLSSVSPEVGYTTAIIEVEGRVLAEVVVPHIPGVVRRYVAA